MVPVPCFGAGLGVGVEVTLLKPLQLLLHVRRTPPLHGGWVMTRFHSQKRSCLSDTGHFIQIRQVSEIRQRREMVLECYFVSSEAASSSHRACALAGMLSGSSGRTAARRPQRSEARVRAQRLTPDPGGRRSERAA